MAFSCHFLLGIAYLVAVASSAVGSECNMTQNRLLCQIVSRVINCSAEGGGVGDNVAYFVQPQPDGDPTLIRLVLASDSDADFSVASLAGLTSCFMLPGVLRLELTPGSGECSLLSGSLDSLANIQSRLTLQIRLAGNRIPAGIFSSRLARLRNLQLETLQVSEVQAGAFIELRNLERLSLPRLQYKHLNRSLLRGLSALRILELANNQLTRLDAASFAASPLLETINLRNGIAEQLTVSDDTFCGLRSLRELTVAAGTNISCSHFASRKQHLRLTSRGQTRVVSCVRMLGQSTVCTGTAGVRWTSTISGFPTTTKVVTTTTTAKSSVKTITSVKSSTTSKAVSTRHSEQNPTTKTTSRTTSTITTPKPVQTSSSATSSSSFSEPSRRSDKPAKSTASGPTTVWPIIAGVGVLISAVLLLVVSVVIFRVIRRARLRRSLSQEPIANSAAGAGDGEIDLQNAGQWNTNFRGGGFPQDASIGVTTE